MTILAPGEKAIVKHSVPWSKHGITYAPVRRPALSNPGGLNAMANLTEAAAEAKDRGLSSGFVDGMPATAKYVQDKLTGVQVRPAYWQEQAAKAAARHAAAPRRAQSFRQRAQAIEARRGGRSMGPVATLTREARF